jgi:hypothetical protein
VDRGLTYKSYCWRMNEENLHNRSSADSKYIAHETVSLIGVGIIRVAVTSFK